MKTLAPLLSVFVGMFHLTAAEIDFAPAPGSPLKLAGGGHSFVMGDVNRDGKPDLVVCNSSNALTVLMGNGRGGFERTTNAPAKWSPAISTGMESWIGPALIKIITTYW